MQNNSHDMSHEQIMRGARVPGMRASKQNLNRDVLTYSQSLVRSRVASSMFMTLASPSSFEQKKLF